MGAENCVEDIGEEGNRLGRCFNALFGIPFET